MGEKGGGDVNERRGKAWMRDKGQYWMKEAKEGINR